MKKKKKKEDSLESSYEYEETALEASYTSNLTVNSGNYFGKTYTIYAHNTGAVVTVNGGNFIGKIQADKPDDDVVTEVYLHGGNYAKCSIQNKIQSCLALR